MVTIKRAARQIEQFISRLESEGVHFSRLVLFGSDAKQQANMYADIDVAVWADEFTGCLSVDYERYAYILKDFSGLELHSYPTGESAIENPFISEIEKNGYEIYLKTKHE